MEKRCTKLNQSGISVVSLVITIIVLLILAAIIFLSSVKTIEEADYSKYTSNISDVSTAFYEKSTAVNGDKTAENNQKNIEQVYNYVAKDGKEEGDFLAQNEVPTYTIIKNENQLGIDLPDMTVESGTGKRVPVTYATTKGGQIFTWPPYDYEQKYWITTDDTVEHKMVTEITVGDETFTIDIDPIYGTLLNAPGTVTEPEEDEEEEPEVVPPAEEHDFSSKTQTAEYLCSEATCTSPAIYYYKCTDCDEKSSNTYTVGNAKGHKYGEYKVVKEPNCTEKGAKQATCENCGSYSTQEIAIDTNKHHGSESVEVTKDATCTEGGTKVYKCSACKAELRIENTEATGHSWGEFEVTQEVSCADEGIKIRVCAKCKKEETEKIPVDTTKHYGTEEGTTTKKPTCTEKGTITYTCSVCGEVTKTEEKPALGHTYGSFEVTKEATCTEKGEKQKTCSGCGKVVTEDIAATGHTYGDPTINWSEDFSSASADFVCSCGKVHTEEAEVVVNTKDPTCEENGEKQYTANVTFGDKTYTETETETVPATGHTGSTDFEWSEDYSSAVAIFSCSCGESQRVNATVTNGITEEPTCTESGKQEYTATVDFYGDLYSNKQTVIIPALGHAYGEPTFTWNSAGTNATVTATCMHGDATTTMDAIMTSETIKQATCKDSGEQKNIATITFGDQTYQEEKVVTIEALGHDGVELTEKITTEANCIETGEKTYTCPDCNEIVRTEEIAINKDNHKELTSVVTKEATCTEKGILTEKCSACDEVFATTDIPLVAHNYDVPVFEWTADYSGSTAISKCKDCGVIEAVVEAKVSPLPIDEATCQEEGFMKYIAEATVNGQLYMNVQEVTLPIKTHDEIELTEKITKEANCTEAGENTYTCPYCSEIIRTEEIIALGHEYTERLATSTYLYSVATCTSPAMYYHKCVRCTDKGTTTYEYGESLGHEFTEEIADEEHLASEATCTKSATYYYDCIRCDAIGTEVFASGDTLEHNWNTEEPRVCTECGKVEVETDLEFNQPYVYTEDENKVEVVFKENGSLDIWINDLQGQMYQSGYVNYVKDSIVIAESGETIGTITEEGTKVTMPFDGSEVTFILNKVARSGIQVGKTYSYIVVDSYVATVLVNEDGSVDRNINGTILTLNSGDVTFTDNSFIISGDSNVYPIYPDGSKIMYDGGVLTIKETPIVFDQPYRGSMNEMVGDVIFHDDGSAEMWIDEFYGNALPAGFYVYTDNSIIDIETGSVFAEIQEAGMELLINYDGSEVKAELNEIEKQSIKYDTLYSWVNSGDTSVSVTGLVIQEDGSAAININGTIETLAAESLIVTDRKISLSGDDSYIPIYPDGSMIMIDGAVLTIKETALRFNQPYEVTLDGVTADMVFYEDGSGTLWAKDLVGEILPEASVIYTENGIVLGGNDAGMGTISSDGSVVKGTLDGMELVLDLKEVQTGNIQIGKTYSFAFDDTTLSAVLNENGTISMTQNGSTTTVPTSKVKYKKYSIVVDGIECPIYPDGTKVMVDDAVLVIRKQIQFEKPYSMSISSGDENPTCVKVTLIFHENGAGDVYFDGVLSEEESFKAGTLTYNDANITITEVAEDGSITTTPLGIISTDGDYIIMATEIIISMGPILESDTTPIHFGEMYTYVLEGEVVGNIVFYENERVEMYNLDGTFAEGMDNAVVYGVNNLLNFSGLIANVSEDGREIILIPGYAELYLPDYDNEFPIEWNSIELANSNCHKQELFGTYVYKISELAPPIDVLNSATLKVDINGEVVEYTVTDCTGDETVAAYGFDSEEDILWDDCEYAFYTIYEPISVENGDTTITFEKGIYVFMRDEWTTDISIDFTLNADYVEPDKPIEIDDDQKANAYLLVLDNSSDTNNAVPMIFVREDEPIESGDIYVSETYGALPVTEVFTGFEDANYNYDSFDDNLLPEWVEGTVLNESTITSVVFEDRVTPLSTCGWFAGMTNCKTIDLEKLDTSNATNMYGMFMFCWSLEELDVSGFDTSNVTDMSHMFFSCSEVTKLEISGFDTSNVTKMDNMFAVCWKLIELDTSNLKTNNVMDMNNMFCGCEKLTSVDVTGFNTSNVTDMSHMFQECFMLKTLDLSSFDTSQVVDMEYMFEDSNELETIYVSNRWDTGNVTSSSYMFSETTSIVGQNGTVYDANYIDVTYAHIDEGTTNPGYLTYKNVAANDDLSATAYALILDNSGDAENPVPMIFVREYEEINVGDTYISEIYGELLVTAAYTNFENVEYYFKNIMDFVVPEWLAYQETITSVVVEDKISPISTTCWFMSMKNCTNMNLYKLDTSEATRMEYMFQSCEIITELNLSTFDTSKVETMENMFEFCYELEKLNVSSFNTGKVTKMNDMFGNCESLITLDLSNFNTSNVTDMNNMFYWCDSLTSLDISVFNTAKVTDMSSMFYVCSSLTTLDVSSFDTSNVIDMATMFYHCSSLTSLDVSNFDTSNVTDMAAMFEGCSSLESLDLTNFNTSKVEDMSLMFRFSDALKVIDLSSFDTSNVIDMQYMFSSCENLTTIYASDLWDVSNVSTSQTVSLFGGCTSLRGAISYNSLNVGVEYANYQTGYLTYKAAPTN